MYKKPLTPMTKSEIEKFKRSLPEHRRRVLFGSDEMGSKSVKRKRLEMIEVDQAAIRQRMF